MKQTISLIKADVGSVGGHTRPSTKMVETARQTVQGAIEAGTLSDGFVWFTGDDIELLMIHDRGPGDETVHGLAWQAFQEATRIAKAENLYGAGQDILKDAFTGNVHGMGPGVAELQVKLRPGESFLVFTCDKTEPGAFNLPLYLAFVDPMNSTGLILKKEMKRGFSFRVMDVHPDSGGRTITLSTPEELYDLAALLRDNHRFVVEGIYSRYAPDEQVVVATTTRLHNIAGKYTGKDDPAMITRVQGYFPAPEEITQAFTRAHYVGGDARGSHNMPLMPVTMDTPASSNFCIPMVSCLAFSLNEQGRLSEPLDYFAHPCWDYVRQKAYRKAEEMRLQGFSGPAMLPMSELEYGGITDTLDALEERFEAPE
ncbi:MAG TPA: fructose 1,6-bisphosphatase [Candidatus Fraserbacteria bacterium]|nr:fructose 1,6-bisphosphatase [Candidatus Fraserbacteria bacterium]